MEENVVLEERKEKLPEKSGGFLKKYKWLVGAVAILALLVCAVCIVCSVLTDAKEQELRDYLDGKIIMDKDLNYLRIPGKEWVIYSFSGNQVSVEVWNKDNDAPVGDLSLYTDYDVSLSLFDNYITLTCGDIELALKRDNEGYFYRIGSTIELYIYDASEIDIADERNDFFCEHEFDIKVITAATCTTRGEEERTCRKCGKVEIATPIKEHNYESNKCTMCGERQKSDISANVWYTYGAVSVLQFQNCEVTNAVISRTSVVTTYYCVCSHCHAVDEMLQMSAPGQNYQVNKLFTCDACGGTTTVKLRVVS